MKHISILGSTGSIGTQCADVAIKTQNCVDLIVFGNNYGEAAKQVLKLKPKYCCAADKETADKLIALVGDCDTEITYGRDNALNLVKKCASDVIYNAVSGKNGLDFTLAAVKTGKRIGLANKESMVVAGNIVNDEAKKYGAEIIPVDSEHSAIFQCLHSSKTPLKRILLTASGGPFYGMSRDEIKNKKSGEALKHPNWDMGKKILIDSATLANKGLEFIEAMRLFDAKPEQIKVVVQRQSIIHSMVEFTDNAVLAQMGTPDMRLCIEYALTYPERGMAISNPLDWDSIDNISIGKVDLSAFPMLKLAMDCAKSTASASVIYNAANEVAVANYLADKIGFYDIYDVCKKCVDKFSNMSAENLSEIEKCDAETRLYAEELCHNIV